MRVSCGSGSRSKILAVCAGLLFGSASTISIPAVRADMIPGISEYISNAELVLRVHAGDGHAADDAQQNKAAGQSQTLLVDDVMKGVTMQQTIVVPSGSLPPGDSALAMVQYEHPNHYRPALQTKPRAPLRVLLLPVNRENIVDTSSIASSTMFKGQSPGPPRLPIAEIADEIKEQTPEQVGLNAQIVALLLFPARHHTLQASDSRRADYVEMIAAILDLDRDNTALIALGESRNAEVKKAATLKMHFRFPAVSTDKQLREAVAFERRERLQKLTKSRWPAVPANRVIPAPSFSAKFLASLKSSFNSAQFTKTFADFLDSGVLADRLIDKAASAPADLVQKYNLGGAVGQSGPYLPSAPRLPPDVVLNDKIDVVVRAKLVALATLLYHEAYLADLRSRALALIETSPAASEYIRQAAFWEPCDTNLQTAGTAAIEKMATLTSAQAQDDMAALFLNSPTNAAVLSAASKWVQGDHQRFFETLLNHARAHSDQAARWTIRIICQAHDMRALPILRKWLQAPASDAREWAAQSLCWFPTKDMVQALLDALSVEQDKKVREQILIALCQTGDKRSLDALVKASADLKSNRTQIEIARGLSRIGEASGLSALAKMAVGATDLQVQFETVNAFGHVSGSFASRRADLFGSSGGIDAKTVTAGLPLIKNWLTSHP